MKDTIKKLVINVVGWTVVAILAFIYSSVLRPLCISDKIIVATLIIVHLYVLFMSGRSLFLLYKTERNFNRLMKSILWLFVLAVILNSGISVSSDALSVLVYGWFGWLIIAFIAQTIIVKKQLDQKRFVRIGLMLVFSLLAIPKFIDDGPIENDWTFEQIAPSLEVQKSYGQLSKFMALPLEEPGLKLVNCDNLYEIFNKGSVLADKAEIKKLWLENKNFIGEFAKLDQFEGVSDYCVHIDPGKVPFLRISQIRNLYLLYGLMVRLNVEEGDLDTALLLFKQTHSIAQKGLKDATNFVNYMIWNAAVSINLFTAKSLTGSKLFDKNNAMSLLPNLVEVNQEYSLAKALKMEYLHFKCMKLKVCANERYHEGLFLQMNNTLRILKEFYSDIIGEIKNVPKHSDSGQSKLLQKFDQYPIEPGNIVGCILARIAVPSIHSIHKTFYETKVRNEILRLRLTEMIDSDISKFIDPYTDKPFVKNKDGEYYSPGPDRKFDTEDDITL